MISSPGLAPHQNRWINRDHGSNRRRWWRLSCLVIASVLSLFWGGRSANAGLGPENVVVVVNASSRDSRTIANHYLQLRHIPSANVVFLKDVPEGLTITLSEFKERILQPLMEELNRKRLAPQTRVIAYSAGFPTSVKIPEHTARLTDPDLKKYQLPTASLTGLTYFYQFVLADNEKYLEWGANLYARGPFARHFANPFFDGERRERFDAAIADRDAGRHDAAAATLEELFEKSRTLAPLGILAAQSRALAGDQDAAIGLLEQAIAAGWTSGTFLEQDEQLSPLMQTPRLVRLKPLLVDYPTSMQEPMAFNSAVGWTGNGWPGGSLQEGVPYLMACMLAVVHPRGSTVEQATRVLETAAKSDATFPEAPFWFTYTRDARTNPRFPQLADALMWLKKSGHQAEILHSAMPTAKSGPCVGLMLGVADIPLENTRWHFVPGALSENLTSLSAQFDTSAQTKITELLHAGAAMSCGPVFEPYNLPFKFPTAMSYAYYGLGTTALEAFYSSVTCPFQLLMVGDPLAQPFARSPSDWVGVKVDSGESGKQRIEFSRRPIPLGDRKTEARAVEIYVEGRLVRIIPAVNRIEMSLPDNLFGDLEVRSVLLGGGPLQPRASHVNWISLNDSLSRPQLRWSAEEQRVHVSCEGATSIELFHHEESLGSIQGEGGTIALDLDSLGDGPVRLRAMALVGEQRVPGRPLVLGLEPQETPH